LRDEPVCIRARRDHDITVNRGRFGVETRTVIIDANTNG
jgi:hypothetical protein